MRTLTLAVLGVLLMLVGATAVASGIRTAHADAPTWTVNLDASSTSANDAILASSASNTKTFRVGAILKANSTTPLNNLYGWQFTINYDPTIVTPQADPLSASGSEAADATVKFGTQTTCGFTGSWAALVAGNAAFAFSNGKENLALHTGSISVFYSLLGNVSGLTVNRDCLMANVAFELVSSPASPLALTISDAEFVNPTSSQLNVVSGTSAIETISNRPPIASFSVTPEAEGSADCTPVTGSPCSAYAFKLDGSTSSDPEDTTIAGPAGFNWDFGDGATDQGVTGAIVIHDYGTPGMFDITLRVVDSAGATGSARNSFGSVIVNQQPSHTSHIVLADVLPTVSFTESSTSAFTGEPITLTISASDSDGTVASIRVDWGDGTVHSLAGTAITDGHAYAAASTYTVSVTAIDDLGAASAPSLSSKTINDTPPVARFTESASITSTGTSISFDASTSSDSDGAIVSYSWNFGDGSPVETGLTTTHSYAVGGIYTVTLTVTDDASLTGTVFAAKTITDRPPVSSFSESATTAFIQDSISFDASASSDPDGTIVSYSWDFGDSSPAGSGVTASHTYAVAGSYTVTLTVTDNDNNIGTSIAVKTINDRPPTVSFTEDKTTALTGEIITIFPISSDSDGTITSTVVNWNDGTVDTFATPTSQVMHTYSKSAVYNVIVTVTDNAGLTATASAIKTINDRPPILSFFEDKTATTTLDPITLTIDAVDGDGTIVGTSIDWGDGTFVSILGVATTATHTYLTAGTYTVTVQVMDDAGLTAHFSATKIISDTPPLADFTESSTSVKVGFSIHFDASVSHDPDGTIASYSWNFGDGTPLAIVPIIDHTYFSTGPFTVTLTVTDDAGLTGTMTAVKDVVLDLAPTVTFTEDKSTALTGETITLTITSADSDGTITATAVDWGDGLVDSLKGPATTATHSYAKAGPYTVLVTVTDDAGLTGSDQAAKTINDRPPAASFTESTTTILTGVAIDFDATAGSDPDGTITNYAWDFGDGSLGSGVTASHSYAKAGPYVVTLMVTDDNGSTASITSTKIITDRPPVASFSESETAVPTGTSISFDATASTDPDGTILTYAWNFGDGLTDSGVTVSHIYAKAGPYTVTLTITDDNGSTDTISATKIINDRPPTASFTESTTATTPNTPIHFDASASIDPDGTILGYEWAFGDGTTDTGSTVDHSYTGTGQFTVTLTVTDDAGLAGTSSAVKTIAINAPPTVSFTEDKTTAFRGETITLTISASDTDGTITSLSVNWGDGTVNSLPGTATGDTHSYSSIGSFTVTVAATDDGGATATAPTATKAVVDQPPVAGFTESTTTALTGISIHFDASTSSDSDGTIATYSWDFGDGTFGSGVAVDHSYSSAGGFAVTLTVMDDAGLTGTLSADKTITANAAPTVSFTEDKTRAFRDETITLTISASDSDGTVAGISVDWGDGTVDNLSGSATSGTHSYTTLGSFTVTVTATDNIGATASQTATKTIEDQTPVAVFTESSTSVFTGVPIDFDATGSFDPDGTIVSYDWNFGDGTTGIGATPSHSYAKAGPYTVTLTVTDNDGSSAQSTSTKTIIDAPPVASFSESSTSAKVGDIIHFDATASSDTDGTIASYSWDFGDGSTGTGATVDHSYTASGTFTVILTVTDDAGLTGTVSAEKIISPQELPSLSFTEDKSSALTGETITLTISASNPSGSISSINVDWGDGTVDNLSGSATSDTHSYAKAGPYTVTVTVMLGDGSILSSTATKTINDRPPIAMFTESNTLALTRVPINFDASDSSDPDGTVALYSWDFGDGNTGTGATTSHSYDKAGSYTVTLTVTDDSGNTGIATTAVKSIGDRPPVASFTVSATTVVLGSPISLDASASSDPDGTIVSFSWSFGDATTGTGVTIDHPYNATGTYTAALLVTDDSGSTGASSQTIMVVKPPPKIILTFQAYDADDYDNGIGELNVYLNGNLVVNVPAGLFHLTGTGSYAPFNEVWVNLGPFDITSFMVQGTNTLVLSNPLTRHSAEIRNVLVVLNDPTTLLDYRQVREVTPTQSVTLTFSNTPFQLTSFTVSPLPVFVTEQRTFTATYTGGVGPFKCTFNFGDGGAAVASSSTQSCTVVHTYWLGTEDKSWDVGGNFTAAVKVQGANTGDVAVASMPLEVLRQPKFTGNGLTWTSTITTPTQNFTAQITNPSHVDILVRIDFVIYPPGDAPATRFTSPSFLIPAGQTRTISFAYTTTTKGFYYFQATMTYGVDLNSDGTLQNTEALGTKAPVYGHFLAA